MGSPEYIELNLHNRASKVVGNIEKIATVLHPATHKQELWTLLYYSVSKQFDYWVRHCLPGDVAEAVTGAYYSEVSGSFSCSDFWTPTRAQQI